jgi:two-component system, chemotaxis family, protein-glutamate methylesterase/glutaminase
MTTDPPRDELAHPVVVAIGVSQDGITALQRVLTPLTAALKASVLIVRHTSPTMPSLLSSILGRVLAMPVKQADAGDRLQAGVVYIAPPDLHLTVVDGHVGLDQGPKVRFTRPSIDVLFESVARVCGARSIGVLLSGGGRDGAAGLAAIRRAGGHTIVQDPSEAVAPYMPLAALATNGHQVLKLDEIGDVLRAAVGRASASPPPSA